MSGRRHRVVAVAHEQMSLFELAAVAEVFGLNRRDISEAWYEFEVCASSGNLPVRNAAGLVLHVGEGMAAIDRADTVLVAGWHPVEETPPAELVDAVRQAWRRGVRVASICGGAFVLAAAGLLDGRAATTHWRYVDHLRQQYPLVQVDPDVLYIDHGDVATSAGTAAGIDLCLHLVRTDLGGAVANEVARRMVVPAHRTG
ncbi:MAG TPA: DJ-1/PfpI family protein, partial [Micromonosporaceae bacterium]